MKRAIAIPLVVALVLAGTVAVASADASGVCQVPGDHATIQAAVNDVSCNKIVVGAGNWSGAEVTRAVQIMGEDGAVIDTGPFSHFNPNIIALRAGFLFPGGGVGSGSTISGFHFHGAPQQGRWPDDGTLDFPIFSLGANNVTIERNAMLNSLQAISNWRGSGWIIEHNRIDGLWVLCGGGIGILVGTFDGTAASGNIIAHNTVLADVSPDCAFYTTPGIALISDTRWGAAGGPIEGNRVLHNRSRVTGTWEGAPAGVGMEIADGGLLYDYPWTGDGIPDVTGNTVAMNDFRGSSLEINFGPSETEDNNTVSRNLGADRGHGGVPASVLFR